MRTHRAFSMSTRAVQLPSTMRVCMVLGNIIGVLASSVLASCPIEDPITDIDTLFAVRGETMYPSFEFPAGLTFGTPGGVWELSTSNSDVVIDPTEQLFFVAGVYQPTEDEPLAISFGDDVQTVEFTLVPSFLVVVDGVTITCAPSYSWTVVVKESLRSTLTYVNPLGILTPSMFVTASEETVTVTLGDVYTLDVAITIVPTSGIGDAIIVPSTISFANSDTATFALTGVTAGNFTVQYTPVSGPDTSEFAPNYTQTAVIKLPLDVTSNLNATTLLKDEQSAEVTITLAYPEDAVFILSVISGNATLSSSSIVFRSFSPSQTYRLTGEVVGEVVVRMEPDPIFTQDVALAQFDMRGEVFNPVFTPLVGVSGNPTPIYFVGVPDGAYIVFQEDSCETAFSATTRENSHAPQQITSGTAYLSPVMTRADVFLRVCFAIEASGGNDDDDYEELPAVFEQLLAPYYLPLRTIVGAEQNMRLFSGRSGDLVYWALKTSGLSCDDASSTINNPSIKTTLYAVTSAFQTFSLDGQGDAGKWTMCYLPKNGTWTVMGTHLDLTIIDKPSFTPTVNLAGTDLDVTFSTPSSYGPTTGDFVVIADNCINAHGTLPTTNSLLPTALSSDLDITVPQTMTTAKSLKVCYATLESDGNSADDYSELELSFVQLSISPARVAAGTRPDGTEQEIVIEGGIITDDIVFTLGSCNTLSGVPSGTQTGYHNINSASDIFHLNGAAESGSWVACYYSTGLGAWQTISNFILTLVEPPVFSPAVGIAGSTTQVSFAGAEVDDYITFKVGSCSNAHQVGDSSSSLQGQIDNLGVSILVSMTTVTALVVCYATSESGGDQVSDFATLPAVFLQRATPIFSPNRTVTTSNPRIFVDGVLAGDMVAWTKTQDCTSLTGSPSAIETGIYTTAVNSSFALNIESSASAGLWTFCVKPNDGLWSLINDVILTIMSVPSFSPEVAYAGVIQRIDFSGDIVLGDIIGISQNGCNISDFKFASNALTTQGLQSVGSFLSAYTNYSMSDPGVYVVCFATKESLGDETTDFAEIPQGYYQIKYSPRRTISGASQEISIVGGEPGDQFGFTADQECPVFTSTESTVQSQAYEFQYNSLVEEYVTFVANGASGSWQLCFKKASGILFTRLAYGQLLVIDEPIMDPISGVSGVVTPLTFSGNVEDGDFVALSTFNCSDAHHIQIDTAYTLNKRTLVNLQISTTTLMSIPITFFVCYATKESGGDTADDYAELSFTYSVRMVLEFEPSRTVSGAAQGLIVYKGQIGDEVAWTLDSTCQAGGSTVNRTYDFYLRSGTNNVNLHPTAAPGVWRMCFTPVGGKITYIPGRDLTIIPQPVLTPLVGVAGSITPITFGGSASSGDYVVIQEGNCGNAHIAPTSANSLSFQIIQNTTMTILTDVAMTKVTQLRICFAVQEAVAVAGNSADDYVMLADLLNHVAPATFDPVRTVAGADQHIVVSGTIGYEYAWSNSSNCSVVAVDGISSMQTSTQAIGLVPETFILQTYASPGTWQFCYKPTGGLWTEVHESALLVIPSPSFHPPVGIAGMVTPLTFSGQITDGDFVVLDSEDCTRPDLVQDSVQSMGKRPLQSSQIETQTFMTQGAINLTVCFASKESNGDTIDDYVPLAVEFNQVIPANFTPNVSLSGAPTLMDVVGGRVLDLFAWSLGSCEVDADSSHLQSQQYPIQPIGLATQVSMHKGTDPGLYKFCFKPYGGLWTQITGQLLEIVARPTYAPPAAFAGIATPLVFTGTASDGDFVVMDAVSCDNAHLTSSGNTTMSITTLNNLTVSTLESMTEDVPLFVCYALSQTSGDGHDDFATLDYQLRQMNFEPKRTIKGAAQPFVVTGGVAGDQVVWTLDVDCRNAGGVETLNKTAEYTLSSSNTNVVLHTTIQNGTYIMCHRANESSVYTEVMGHVLLIIDQPAFAPAFGFAGVIQSIGFDSPAQDGDFIVLLGGSVGGPGCGGAASANTGPNALGKTALVLKSVSTLNSMVLPADYSVCYATQESGGDSDGDFSTLPRVYVTFGFQPTRTVEGAEQIVELDRGAAGDKILFTKESTCDTTYTGPSTNNRTQVYNITSHLERSRLPSDLDGGIYYVCYLRGEDGPDFFKLIGVTLIIIPRPLSTPSVGVSGSITPLNITGSILDGDFVVLNANGCSNASATVTTSVSQFRETLLNDQISTNVAVNEIATLKICFATKESFGDSPDDYVELTTTLQHVKPPLFDPVRFAEGTSQVVSFADDGSSIVGGKLTFHLHHISCDSMYEDVPNSKTGVIILNSNATDAALNATLIPGDYSMCYWPYNGLPTNVTTLALLPYVPLLIIPRPTFFPPVGIAGSVTTMSFSGFITDHDIIMMQENNCSNAHVTLTGSAGLKPTNIINSSVRTHVNMTKSTVLVLCFASKESTGDSSDDYVQLDTQFIQRVSPNYTPRRTITGSNQIIKLTNYESNDVAAWTTSSHCNETATIATSTQTREYVLGSLNVTLHNFTNPDTWTLCYLPSGGVWTKVTDRELFIIPKPVFTPLVGIAGSITTMTFTGYVTPGVLYTPDVYADGHGDFIVMQEGSCNHAHQVITGGRSLVTTSVTNTSQVDTNITMQDFGIELRVCYATRESGGDSADDYTDLTEPFAQVKPPDFDPKRTVSGAKQLLNVTSMSAGDQVAWTSLQNCHDYNSLDTQTLEKTSIYSLGSNSTYEQVELHSTAQKGFWKMCYKLVGGIWTGVTNRQLTVISRPTFTPTLGISGSITPLTFNGSQTGDFIVLQQNNCDNSHIVVSSEMSLPKTAISNTPLCYGIDCTTYPNSILTHVNMTLPTALKVCFASMESGGNSPDDFTALDLDFEQITSPDFHPKRASVGTAQLLNVTIADGFTNATVVWTQSLSCVSAEGDVMNNKTTEYLMHSDSELFRLHTDAAPGNYHLCFKLFGGVFTRVTGLILLLIPEPVFFPPVGIAGSVTPITFNGTVAGDFVVLREENCSNAHLTATSSASLEQTTLGDTYFGSHQALTTLAMAKVTTLKICFASQESFGNSPDDYLELAHPFVQLLSPDIDPVRTISGAAQNINVSHIHNNGDLIAWTQESDCLNTTSFSTPIKTEEYTLQGAYWEEVAFHRDTTPGVFHTCYKLAGGNPDLSGPGVWTQLTARELTMIERPTFYPITGVAGSNVKVEFNGSIDGDFLTFQQHNCSNAHLTVTGNVSTERTVIGAVDTSSIITDELMIYASDYVICYATLESRGDTEDDYVALDVLFTQVEPMNFDPKRTVTGAPQYFNLTGGFDGDTIVFTRHSSPYCDGYNLDGPATTEKTAPFVLTNDTVVSLPSNAYYAPVATLGAASTSGMRTQRYLWETNGGATPGEWHMCYKPLGGVYIYIRNYVPDVRNLHIMSQPIYAPTTSIAGSTVPMTFTNPGYGWISDGDFVAMAIQGTGSFPCQFVVQTISDDSNLRPTQVVNISENGNLGIGNGLGIVVPVTLTTPDITLDVCYATKESVLSNYNSDDDYVKLPQAFSLVIAPYFNPVRTVAGAAQILNIYQLSSGDAVAWTTGNCVTDVNNNGFATSELTPVYSQTGTQFPVILHTVPRPTAGSWSMCVKLFDGGIWMTVRDKELFINPLPTFFPHLGVAAHETKVNLVESQDDDFIVITTGGCGLAYTVAITAATQTAQLVSDLSALTTTVMNFPATLVLCYATAESRGDSSDDYAQLDGYFIQILTPLFFPIRTVSGAKQLMDVSSTEVGDNFVWSKSSDCLATYVIGNATKLNVTTPASASKTAVYTLQNDEASFPLLGIENPGEWYLCYRPNCFARSCYSSNTNGSWTRIHTLLQGPTAGSATLTVEAHPTLFPLVSIAGSVTPLTFQGPMIPTDFIVLQLDNCSGASTAITASSSMEPTEMILIAGNILVRTQAAMTSNTTLAICYATTQAVQSEGNSDDDYAQLEQSLEQLLPLSYAPDRTVEGAAQLMQLRHISPGDQLTFTLYPDCTYNSIDDGATTENLPVELESPYSNTKTITYTLEGNGTDTVALHTTLDPGVMSTCFKPTGGVWTRILPWDLAHGGISRHLFVIPKPTFDPLEGNAGTATAITFNGNITDNDVVVLQEEEDGCDNAHLVATSVYNLGPTLLNNSQIFTLEEMIKGGRRAVCYATKETGGLVATDFSRLDTDWQQKAPPDFEPFRTVSGANQRIKILVQFTGDEVYWTLDTCNFPSDTDQPRQTQRKYMTNFQESVNLATISNPGVWRLCHKFEHKSYFEAVNVVPGGRQAILIVIVPPIFSPPVGIAGSVTPITFSIGTFITNYTSMTGESLSLPQFAPLDLVVFQHGDCNNLESAVTSSESLGLTAINNNSIVYTGISMITPIELKVCFACSETFGDATTDFVELLDTFTQRKPPSFTPNRTVETAAQILHVTDVFENDRIYWTKASECNVTAIELTTNYSESATLVYMLSYALHSTDPFIANMFALLLHQTASPGSYRTCFQPYGGGVWGTVFGATLEIIPVPSFSPGVGIAGSVTPVYVNGSTNGDFFTLQVGNCIGAETVQTTAASLGKTSVTSTIWGDSFALTTTIMSRPDTILVMCFATLQSRGDSSDDYIQLSGTLFQRGAPYFWPNRTVAGAAQNINVTAITSEDQIAWAQESDNCLTYYSHTGGMPQGDSRTENYELTHSGQEVTLHTEMSFGDYDVCFRPLGGVWTKITGLRLRLIPQPAFSPLVGIAGSVTPLTFNGTIYGDVVVLKLGNCTGAATTVSSNTSIDTTVLSSSWVPNFGNVIQAITTTLNQTADVNLTLCFATQEAQMSIAGGNSDDDYITLAEKFRNREPTQFAPKSIIVENYNILTFSGGEKQDRAFFTQAENCSYYEPYIRRVPEDIIIAATLTITDTYVLNSTFQSVVIGENTSIGVYTLCYQPAGGLFTVIATLDGGTKLDVLPQPSDDILTFSIIRAPYVICYKDTFKATVEVELLPENLKTAFEITMLRDDINNTVYFNPPMTTTYSSFEYIAEDSFGDPDNLDRSLLGFYRLEVFGIDPLWRIELDITKTHEFEVTESAVVPLTLLNVEVEVFRFQPVMVKSEVGNSNCVLADFTAVGFNWTLADITDCVPSVNVSCYNIIPDYSGIVYQAATLYVPENILLPGHKYLASVTAVYMGLPQSVVTISTTVSVGLAPIHLSFLQGYRLAFGTNNTIRLDTVLDDPDGMSDDRRVSFRWAYDQMDTYGSLLYNATEQTENITHVLINATSYLQFPPNTLNSSSVYRFNVTAIKPNVSDAFAQIFVEVYSQDVPLVNIISGQLGSDFISVDYSRPLTLLGSATLNANEFEWSHSAGSFINDPDTVNGNVLLSSNTNNVSADLTLNAYSIPADSTMELKLAAKQTGSSVWGYTAVRITTTEAPHSGSFEIVYSGDLVALSTKVTFQAISWRDNTADFPTLYQFGYFFVEDGALVGQPFVVQPFSTLTSLQTAALPVGTLQPVLWVQDKHGATRMVYFGCDDYRINGVWATHIKCLSIQTLVVQSIDKHETESYTARMTRYLDDYDMGNYDGMTVLNFLTTAGWIHALDDVQSTACIRMQCAPIEVLTFRDRLLDMIDQLMDFGHPVPTSQSFRFLSPLLSQVDFTFRPTFVQSLERTFDRFIEDTYNPTYGYVSGLDSSTASVALETLAATTLFRNSTQNSSNTNAFRLQHRIKQITDLLIEGQITNEPTVIVNAYSSESRRLLIEVGCYQGSVSAMQNNSVNITLATVYFPNNISYISDAQLTTSDTQILSAAARQAYDVHRVCISYFASWFANPYSYDTTRDLRSGIVNVQFSDVNAHELSWSHLKLGNELRIGLRLTDPSGSPKCFYRRVEEDDYHQGDVNLYDKAYFQGDYYLNEEFQTQLSLITEDLKPYAFVSNVTSEIVCRTNQNKLGDSLIISDGCYCCRNVPQTQSCSSHGFCNHDSSCHCVCGHFTRNCSDVHIAAMAQPSKNRYFSGAPLFNNITNNATGGKVALVHHHRGRGSCTGAGSVPVSTYATGTQTSKIQWGIEIQKTSIGFGGAQMDVVPPGLTQLPHVPNTPLAPSQYSVCFCNAEKVRDPLYSNCNMDCAYNSNGDTMTIIDAPRIGPLEDQGHARMVRDTDAIYRITAGHRQDTAVVNGDKIFATPGNCSKLPETNINASHPVSIFDQGIHDVDSLSAFFSFPDIVTLAPFYVLKLCFATLEMGTDPSASDFAELQDTMTIIVPPKLNTGEDGRSVTGTAPNFVINGADGTGGWGVDGGDYIYMRSSCIGPVDTGTDYASVPFRLVKYNDPVLGPPCDRDAAVDMPVVVSASSMKTVAMSRSTPWCGTIENALLDSSSAWCPQVLGHREFLLNGKYKYTGEYASSNIGQWLEVDVGSVTVIARITTQGRHDFDEWVEEYSISTSEDGITWKEYRKDGILVLFQGNIDRDTMWTNQLEPSVIARHVRFYPKLWRYAMAMRAGVAGCPAGVVFELPTSPLLTADGSTSRVLKMCFATRRSEADHFSDYLTLPDVMKIVPEPTNPLTPIYLSRGQVFEMEFSVLGDSVIGILGDTLVLSKGRCEDAWDAKGTAQLPHTSGMLVLDAAGEIPNSQVSEARLNGLNTGKYNICYATAESLNDVRNDLNALTAVVEIFVDEFKPALIVAPTAIFGQDIVVSWEASSSLSTRASNKQDWIGLYKKGECRQVDYTAESLQAIQHLESAKQQNRCSLATIDLPDGRAGGQVRFSSRVITQVGEYEVRYFMGDSHRGQGYVCRRLQTTTNLDTESEFCALEAAAHSDTIEVTISLADGTIQHISEEVSSMGEAQKLPGLETYCEGQDCYEM